MNGIWRYFEGGGVERGENTLNFFVDGCHMLHYVSFCYE
jgi:hypothetical protein